MYCEELIFKAWLKEYKITFCFRIIWNWYVALYLGQIN